MFIIPPGRSFKFQGFLPLFFSIVVEMSETETPQVDLFSNDKMNILLIIMALLIPLSCICVYEYLTKKGTLVPKEKQGAPKEKQGAKEIQPESTLFPSDENLRDILPQTDNCLVADSGLPGGGRGVFAKKNFKIGDVIEVCPFLVEKNPSNIEGSVINDYVFNYVDDEGHRSIVLGLCSMYNHSDTQNVGYKQITNPHNMVYMAEKEIQRGDELFINYGENYWDTRQTKKT